MNIKRELISDIDSNSKGDIVMTEKILKNTPIHYWSNDTKDGSAILFIHPAFANHTCFDTQVDYFKDYRVITMDLIGHGKSIGRGSIADTAFYIKQIMEFEKIGN